MIDENIINSGSDFISKSDSWGVNAFSVFFVLVLVGVFVYFSAYLVKNISKVVENNTDALNRNIDKTDRNFDDIKHKQDEMHSDIKEILHNTKDK